MSVRILSINHSGRVKDHYPGIALRGQWLADMGFIGGALVQALPEPGGVMFRLCNENIIRYSDLHADTKEQGGRLIQSLVFDNRPGLSMTGQLIVDAGIALGDSIIVKYEYGLIRVRKFPKGARVIHVTNAKDPYTGELVSRIRLCGVWLPELGFAPDAVVTAAAVSGSVVLKLHDTNMEQYSDLVRYARKNKLELLQVRQISSGDRQYPYITLMGVFADKAGFVPGDTLAAYCEHGQINLQRLDFDKLGF